jgi:hypothetical protein
MEERTTMNAKLADWSHAEVRGEYVALGKLLNRRGSVDPTYLRNFIALGLELDKRGLRKDGRLTRKAKRWDMAMDLAINPLVK